MRGRKSIYYMTDSELIAYKKHLRRKQILKKRITTAIMTLCMVTLFTIFYFSIRSSANVGDSSTLYKYYTSVTLESGDSLWDIADTYIDYSKYKSKEQYIKEIKNINHIEDPSILQKGESIIVPYYSSEFIL